MPSQANTGSAGERFRARHRKEVRPSTDGLLAPEVLQKLKWYLEDYLLTPYAVYERAGQQVAESLGTWGRALYGALLSAGAPLGDTTPAGTDLVISSDSPEVMAQPWELLQEPAASTPLALGGSSVTREIPGLAARPRRAIVGERLRVLMLISRPAGGDDVGYQLVARPLLQQVEPLDPPVDLVVARPPTFDSFQRLLDEARGRGDPFHIVHFDGHGALESSASGDRVTAYSAFEQTGGGGLHKVRAARVAQALAAAEIPLVVLNACESGAIPRDVEGALAVQMLKAGVGSVVAMSHKVYAAAAATFVTAFYSHLLSGGSVVDAVSAGRLALARQPLRPSARGLLPLSDWAVPVHYRAQEVAFQSRTRGHLRIGSPPGHRQKPNPGHPQRFVGRDVQFYQLEAGLTTGHVMSLHGPVGIGKTALVEAFATWWQRTAGGSRVVMHSFASTPSAPMFTSMIENVGLQLLGEDFGLLEEAVRTEVLHEVLTQQRCLLVWDDADLLASLQHDSAEDHRQLLEFIDRLSHEDSSALVIASRAPLTDLVRGLETVTVAGLTSSEAAEYADALLTTSELSRHRSSPEFQRLLDRLGGNPLCMRLVLPGLASSAPGRLLAILDGNLVGTEQNQLLGYRLLMASVALAHDRLDPGVRRVLPVLAVLEDVAEVATLAAFSSSAPDPWNGLSAEDWEEVLGAAAAVGLLTPMQARAARGSFRIHPGLRSYLAERWRQEEGSRYSAKRAAVEDAMTSTYSALAQTLAPVTLQGDTGWALAFLDIHYRSFAAYLRRALRAGRSADASAIYGLLSTYVYRRNRRADEEDLIGRVFEAVHASPSSPPDDDGDGYKESLWVSACLSLGVLRRRQGALADAEAVYQCVARVLRPRGDQPGYREQFGICLYQLANIEVHQQRIDNAEAHYLEALERLTSEPTALIRTRTQLGIIAHERGDYDRAESWYRSAFDLCSETGDQVGAGDALANLSLVCLDRGDLDRAEEASLEAARVFQAMDRPEGLANCFVTLGEISQMRQEPAKAEEFFASALDRGVSASPLGSGVCLPAARNTRAGP